MLGLSQIFSKQTVAGIDIGSRLIKAVQIEPNSHGGWRITHAAVAPSPTDCIREGVIVNPQAVSVAVRELLKSAGIDATGAVAAIGGASVIVRHVILPRISETALRKSIRYEASKYISSSIDDSIIEFEITGNVPGEDDKMAAMLVAAPINMVESRLAVLEGAGIEPIAIDLEAFAMQRALLDLSATQPGDGETIALLDIGALNTDVNIVSNGHFALTRNIAIAGDSFTNTLRPIAQKTEWNDLEELKLQLDMSALLQSDALPEAIALAQLAQPVIDELLREVRRSINYYQSQLSDPTNSNLPLQLTTDGAANPVSKIVITGGSARLRGLDVYMSARLGFPVEIWNVFENPIFDTSAFSPEFLNANHTLFGTAIGLALKESMQPPVRATPSRRSALIQAA